MIDINSHTFNLIDALEYLKLVKSRSEAKRLIKSQGVRINNKIFNDESYSLTKFTNTSEIKILVGKKKIGLIKLY